MERHEGELTAVWPAVRDGKPPPTPATRYADIAAHHARTATAHAARRNAHSLIRPEHPTRLGGRLHAPAVR